MDSNLQIISGLWRGKKLYLPGGARPSQNKARIALFNMLNDLGLRPGVVWDAFAGSGALGIECLSRWPDVRVIFTDLNISTVQKNISVLPGLASRVTVVKDDALAVVNKFAGDADLVFVDPPYDSDLAEKFVTQFFKAAKQGAIVVVESDSTSPEFLPAGCVVLKNKTFGRARLRILQKS